MGKKTAGGDGEKEPNREKIDAAILPTVIPA